MCSCVFFPLVREITLPVTSGSLSDGECWCCLRLLRSKKIKEYLAVYRIAHYAKLDRVPSLDISSHYYKINLSSRPFVPITFGPGTKGGFCPGSNG